MNKNVLVSGFLLVLISSSLACTSTARQQNKNQSTSQTPSSKWIKISSPMAAFQELTFSANGELYVLYVSGLMRSTDNGRSWNKIKIDSPALRDYFNLTCVAIAKDGLILVGAKSTGGDSIIFRSSDGGKTWTHTKFMPKGEDISYEVESLALSSNGDLLAGADFGTIFRSTDSGKTWTAIGKLQVFETVAALALGPDGQLYAAIAKTGIFQSVDGGRTWAETGYGKNSVDSVVVNKKGHLFAGTLTRGVFRSIDGGKTWVSINEGLPMQDAPALALDKDGYLYVGAFKITNGFFRSTHSTIADRDFFD